MCVDGFTDCDGASTNGCETDPRTSATNCGACGVVCAAGRACVASACSGDPCLGGYGNCDGIAANGCETNTRTSSVNCGACGHVCGAGQRCEASAWVADADAGALDAGADVPRDD